MLIQPEAHNAVCIILDDKSEIELHHTIHGDRDRLVIANRDGLTIDLLVGTEWRTIGKSTLIRVTAKEV